MLQNKECNGMKQYSVYFNKKSRLYQSPEVTSDPQQRLPALDAAGLTDRLASLLTIQNDFFPCFDWSFPPPILSKAPPPATVTELFDGRSVIPGRYSLYMHSPFCKTLCSFCYYSVIPGRGISESATYIDYLTREMAMYAQVLRGMVCESVYFGGGTPTYLDDSLLTKVFENLHDLLDISADAEITIEASPGTLPRDKLMLLKSLGVNRISYGIQTLDEKLLAGMNRHYAIAEAIGELTDAVELIGNVNVDTMYGFDGEPDNALFDTLDRFHTLGVPSLSIYSLDKQRSAQKSNFIPPRDDAYEHKIRLFQRAEDFLAARGYRPVLQNVFVNPERGAYTHQVRRWDNLPLVALGINAQGYAPRKPYQNIAGIKSYYEAIDAGRPPVATVEPLTPEMELCRELTSKLRFTAVDCAAMRRKYGVDIDRVFDDLINALLDLGYIEREDGVIRMTRKSAYYNNIIPMLFSPDEFKERLLGLPEEYIEEFPIPYILTRLGATQSAAMAVSFTRADGAPERRATHERRCGIERRRQTRGMDRRHRAIDRRSPTCDRDDRRELA
jgi:oxygen-independent coproporphyrinogen-3 oxidase